MAAIAVVAGMLAIAVLWPLPSSAAIRRQRYVINPNSVTWPFPTLLYLNPRVRVPNCRTCLAPHPASILRAIRAWNAAGVGYQFEQTEDPAQADVWFLGSKYVKPRTCEGNESFPGYAFNQDWIVITGPCDRYMTTLLAAHEIGHLLGLSHETKGCAIMNEHAFEPRGHPELAYPEHCKRGKQYWRSPVMPDDRAGVGAIRSRPTRWPYLFCFTWSGQFDTEYARNDPLCMQQYDCRGTGGTASISGGEDLGQFADCRQEPYDKAGAKGEYATH